MDLWDKVSELMSAEVFEQWFVRAMKAPLWTKSTQISTNGENCSYLCLHLGILTSHKDVKCAHVPLGCHPCRMTTWYFCVFTVSHIQFFVWLSFSLHRQILDKHTIPIQLCLNYVRRYYSYYSLFNDCTSASGDCELFSLCLWLCVCMWVVIVVVDFYVHSFSLTNTITVVIYAWNIIIMTLLLEKSVEFT